jgi:hypothetical protein
MRLLPVNHFLLFSLFTLLFPAFLRPGRGKLAACRPAALRSSGVVLAQRRRASSAAGLGAVVGGFLAILARITSARNGAMGRIPAHIIQKYPAFSASPRVAKLRIDLWCPDSTASLASIVTWTDAVGGSKRQRTLRGAQQSVRQCVQVRPRRLRVHRADLSRLCQPVQVIRLVTRRGPRIGESVWDLTAAPALFLRPLLRCPAHHAGTDNALGLGGGRVDEADGNA